MIYRVTLTKGWISKDIRHCGWKTIIFRWLLWLFANWLIRGDSALCSLDWGWLTWSGDWCVLVSSLTSPVSPGAGNRTERVTGNRTSPARLPSGQETEKQIALIRIVPSLALTLAKYHRSYLHCREWEHFSTNWEWPQHKQGRVLRARHNPRHAVSRSHDRGMRVRHSSHDQCPVSRGRSGHEVSVCNFSRHLMSCSQLQSPCC